ncbi:MAG: class I SAM-dependent methyltransferase [Aquaticitalea sp.]
MNIIDKFHNWRRKQRWNKQYKNGLWDNLNSETERIRYQTIIDFISTYGSKHPKILDLGCGAGILCNRLKNVDYNYFLGMDFSSVSIEKANSLHLNKAEFICADLHIFMPNQNFDIIVFNEVFYYINDNEKENVLNRMIGCLNEDGIFITSMYREGISCWEVFDSKLKQLQFTTVTTDNEKTYWKIGVYKAH